MHIYYISYSNSYTHAKYLENKLQKHTQLISCQLSLFVNCLISVETKVKVIFLKSEYLLFYLLHYESKYLWVVDEDI